MLSWLLSRCQKARIRVFVVSPGDIQTEISTNALTGKGGKYGKTDADIADGMTVEAAAKAIIEGLLNGREEMLLAPISARLGIAVRTLAPSLFFWIMKQRAECIGRKVR